jgi:hypothetical protein
MLVGASRLFDHLGMGAGAGTDDDSLDVTGLHYDTVVLAGRGNAELADAFLGCLQDHVG